MRLGRGGDAPSIEVVDAGRGGLRRRARKRLLWTESAAEIALVRLETLMSSVAAWAVVVLAGERTRLQQSVALAVLGPASREHRAVSRERQALSNEADGLESLESQNDEDKQMSQRCAARDVKYVDAPRRHGVVYVD
jgi:hypothetical protein